MIGFVIAGLFVVGEKGRQRVIVSGGITIGRLGCRGLRRAQRFGQPSRAVEQRFRKQVTGPHGRDGCRRPLAQFLGADQYRRAVPRAHAREQFDQRVLRRHASAASAASVASAGSFGSIPEAFNMSRNFRSSSSYLSEQELGCVMRIVTAFGGVLASLAIEAASSTWVTLYRCSGRHLPIWSSNS